jgi:excisionase family DNA binding protein
MLYTVDQAVERLGGIKRSTFYVMLRSGEIESVQVPGSRRRLIRASALREFVDRLAAPAEVDDFTERLAV